ncbi:MAG: polyhydroxyalkanoate synthesis regulator DNA-binding domain-containing protein [Planctomycetota bacterium]
MPEPEVVRINRYPNRRYYNRTASKYISLDDIERLVVEGKRVEIQDNQSKEDITRSVLARILLERQPDKMLLFPSDMLHFILRANEVSTGFLKDYFRHSLTYLDYLSTHNPAASTLVKPMHWVKAWLDGIGSAAVAATGEDGPTNGSSVTEKPSEHEVELEQRVRELEERIQQLEGERV